MGLRCTACGTPLVEEDCPNYGTGPDHAPIDTTSPAFTLMTIERYCRMMRYSMSVPMSEVADDILTIIKGGES